MLHQDHLTSSTPEGPLHMHYMHMPTEGVPINHDLLLVTPLTELPWIWLTTNSQVRWLATLHLRICMDLWQIQHFPVLSLKNYQLCVIVQNANIPMIAFKKSQTINNPTKKIKKVEKKNQTGPVAEVCTAGSPRSKQIN